MNNRVSTIRFSGWDQDDLHGTALSHLLTQMVLTSSLNLMSPGDSYE